MELFSVACITCRSKLKVRHPSAIGQILPCPKCGGMVQITPPDGWTMPASTELASPANVAPVDDDAESALPVAARFAEPVDGDAPLTPPAAAVAPGEARVRRIIVIAGCAAAAMITAFGLWSTFGAAEPVGDDEPSAAPPIAQAAPSAAASPSAAPVASATNPAPAPAASSTADAPPAVALATATPVPAAAPTAGDPAVAVAVPSGTAAPPPGAVVVDGNPVVPPPPEPQPPIDVAPLEPPVRPIPPAMIDLTARLDDKFPALTFDGTSLRRALALLGQLSTIRISYDWDAMPNPAVVRRPVTWTLTDVTVRAAIEKLLTDAGLEPVPLGDQLLVRQRQPIERPTSVGYDVSDLAADEVDGTRRIIERLQTFVAPETWKRNGGRGTLQDDGGGRLTIIQPPRVQRETASFLDRLRLIRGKPPRNPAASLATRFDEAREILTKPVMMNFRPGVPLEEILAYLENATGATITVDYPALVSAGYQGSEAVGCAANQNPLHEVLTALCGPREWAWRVVGPETIDLTTREALRRRQYVEFYRAPVDKDGEPLGEAAAQQLVLQVRTQLPDEGWRATGGRAEIMLDPPSGGLIVLQHQEAQYRIERIVRDAAPADDAAAAPPNNLP